MLRVLLYFLTNIATITVLSKLLDSFEVRDLTASFMFVILLTLLNFTVIPVIKFLTFPINFVTLGLFYGLINILTITVVANTIKGVELIGSGSERFFTSLLIAVSLSVVQSIVGKLNHK